MDTPPEQKPTLAPMPPPPDVPSSAPLSEQMNSVRSETEASINQLGEAPKRHSMLETSHKARAFGIISSLVVVALVLSAVGWYFVKGQPKTIPLVQKSLSDSDLQKLSVSTIGYDSSSQQLTFHSPLSIDKDLKVNGTAVIKNLTVTGKFTHDEVSLQKSLEITGDTLLHGEVTAKSLFRADGNLIVGGSSTFNGNASFNKGANFAGSLSADSINVKSATIGGLTFGHVVTTGLTPTGSIGIGAGGGSFTVSGNDTSGTATINVGGGAHTGDLINVAFRAPFSSTPHVNLTPVGASSAGTAYYVTRSVTGFTIGMVNPVPGSSYIFDFLVTQ